MSVDLHLHTTASDGSFTPKMLVQKALEFDYNAISITDHDTVAGLKPALKYSRNTSLEIIPGIEINTEIDRHEVHILGYFIDFEDQLLINKLKFLKEKRIERAKKILDRLKDFGIKISWQYIIDNTEKSSIGRGHIARAMIKLGYVDTWEEAFSDYLGIKALAYVPRERITTTQAINSIRKAGGIPILAHPAFVENDDLVHEIIAMGVIGLEVYYYEHSAEEIKKYEKIALDNNLLLTGGSDGHGPGNKDGMRLGKVKLDYNIVKSLKKYKKEKM